MLNRKFLEFCVLKLGAIYLVLALFVFKFVEYKMNSGSSWMSGWYFATTGWMPFLLFSGIIFSFLYGAYYWLIAFYNFVFKPVGEHLKRFLTAAYLLVAPLAATEITSLLFGVLLA